MSRIVLVGLVFVLALALCASWVEICRQRHAIAQYEIYREHTELRIKFEEARVDCSYCGRDLEI